MLGRLLADALDLSLALAIAIACANDDKVVNTRKESTSRRNKPI